MRKLPSFQIIKSEADDEMEGVGKRGKWQGVGVENSGKERERERERERVEKENLEMENCSKPFSENK